MIFRMSLAAAVAILASTASAKNFNIPGMLDEIPDTGAQWQTLGNGVEFQPAQNLSPLAEYHLRRLTSGSTSNSTKKFQDNPFDQIFIDGTETYYDEFAQAWRALGFYIDCDYCSKDRDDVEDEYCIDWTTYKQNNGNNDDDDDDDDDEDEHEREEKNKHRGCQRFMLWAAYIDEEYEGGDVGEYAYYDRKKGRYDYSACKKTNSDRCVKMDCHEPNTHFSLLGYFKEPNYDEWMEQLFKHLGDCVWSDEEYQLMQMNREAWPSGCIQTHVSFIQNGQNVSLYYDLKPEKYGDMNIALYTDKKCITEYKGNEYQIGQVLEDMICSGYINGGDLSSYMCGNYGSGNLTYWESLMVANGGEARGNAYSLEYDLKKWNDAFDVFKQCQPCKAYDLTNWVAPSKYNNTGYRQQDGRDNNNNNNEEGNFICHDAAGYNDVNQCMKFKTKTKMLTATWRDVELAASQGTTTDIRMPYPRSRFSDNRIVASRDRLSDKKHVVTAWTLLVVAAALLGSAYFSYVDAKEALDRAKLKEPLVPTMIEAGVVA